MERTEDGTVMIPTVSQRDEISRNWGTSNPVKNRLLFQFRAMKHHYALHVNHIMIQKIYLKDQKQTAPWIG